MKNVKTWLLPILLLLPLGMAFAGVSGKILEKPSLSYGKDLSEAEMMAVINSAKGLLPVMVNQEGAFFDEKEKARVVAAAVAQVKAKNSHRAHYNAAIVFATYPYVVGYDTDWKLSPSEAANAIRHATIALNLSSESKENVPYMYLVRGKVRMDQGLEYDGPHSKYKLRDLNYAQDAWADFKEVERLNPQLTSFWHLKVLAEVLGKKAEAAKYSALWERQQAAEQAARKEVLQQTARQKVYQEVGCRVSRQGLFMRTLRPLGGDELYVQPSCMN